VSASARAMTLKRPCAKKSLKYETDETGAATGMAWSVGCTRAGHRQVARFATSQSATEQTMSSSSRHQPTAWGRNMRRDQTTRRDDFSRDATTVTEAQDRPGLMPPAESPAPISGHTIGQYEVIRCLGRGGMGEVHLARDLRLGRLVAIKLLTGHDASLTERFLAEARVTARCNHENIVVIHEVGEHAGHPYMVLEYLKGQTLRQWLNEQPAPAAAPGTEDSIAPRHAPVPPGRAVELMLPVVRALAYAHERGIVHRDLKPENVMLTRSGNVKVLDFGIAKLLSAPEPVPEVTVARALPAAAVASSSLIGTLPYMSPEQMNVGAIDHRSDLWTVGIMLFEMVTGRHPLPSLSMLDLLRIADNDVDLPRMRERMPDIGPLGAVIDRCLIKDPEHRTASARDLLAELEALAPVRRTAQVRDDGSPFAGLAAFQEADADRFFGRARDIRQIVAQLRSQPLVAVVGPSGFGKSSLIRAGVIPALKCSGEGWDAYVLRPGRHPLAALAGALAQIQSSSHATSGPPGAPAQPPVAEPPASHDVLHVDRLRTSPGHLGVQLRGRAATRRRRILLFVDQFEELYTLGVPADERAAFLACLAAVADDAASPLRVVLSMRSDFLDRLAEDRHFSAEATRGLVLLPAMGREGLREALTCPVEATEFRFESPALIDRMVDELDATPGALPLLQFTAARLWELRDTGRRLLTEASYERIGGVAGALASHADAVLAGMSSQRQALVRTVLERLVTPGRTRALVCMGELRALHRDGNAVDDVVQHLAAMRLLVIENGAEGGDHTVELVHESLITRWPTLARWLDENHEDAAFLARLRSAAQEWETRSRDEGLLWRGTPAREAQLWYERHPGTLPGREQAYLDAVLALASRAVRGRRRIVGGIMAAMAVLLVGAAVALIEIQQARQEAGQQAEIARAQAVESERARRDAEAARQEAAQQAQAARDRAAEAESARKLAEAERTRAEQESARAREALAQAQRSEARAYQAESKALSARDRAESESRAKQREQQKNQTLLDQKQELLDQKQELLDQKKELIDRSLGPVRKSLRAPAP
jgi:serine/threonine protein kinase